MAGMEDARARCVLLDTWNASAGGDEVYSDSDSESDDGRSTPPLAQRDPSRKQRSRMVAMNVSSPPATPAAAHVATTTATAAVATTAAAAAAAAAATAAASVSSHPDATDATAAATAALMVEFRNFAQDVQTRLARLETTTARIELSVARIVAHFRD